MKKQLPVDTEKYAVNPGNYHPFESFKKQILIGHSCSDNFEFVKGWKNRSSGKYKRTASFSIAQSGRIYQHYPPVYFSDFSSDPRIDAGLIQLNLINEGWLQYLSGAFYNWEGARYKRDEKVVEKLWRGRSFWAPYPEKQIKSLVKLVTFLCRSFEITPEVLAHHVKFKDQDVNDFTGIVFRSNYFLENTDLSPAFPMEQFLDSLADAFATEEKLKKDGTIHSKAD